MEESRSTSLTKLFVTEAIPTSMNMCLALFNQSISLELLQVMLAAKSTPLGIIVALHFTGLPDSLPGAQPKYQKIEA